MLLLEIKKSCLGARLKDTFFLIYIIIKSLLTNKQELNVAGKRLVP